MAVFRAPTVFRGWRDDRNVAINGQLLGANRLLNELKSLDKFFYGPGRGPTYDWPNPQTDKHSGSRTQGRRDQYTAVRSQGEVWQERNSGLYKGKDTFWGAPGQVIDFDWPNPNLGKPFPVDQRGFTLTLVNDTLRPIPNNEYDWPNPRGYVFSNDLRGFLNPLEPNLLGKDKFFGLGGRPQFDWPVPKGPVPPIDQRTWLDPLKRNLIGQDRFYGGPGEVPAHELVNPAGAAYPNDLRGWLLPLKSALSVVVPGVPFVPYDWTMPSQRQQTMLHVTAPGYNLNLVPVPTPPSPGSAEWLIRARRRNRR